MKLTRIYDQQDNLLTLVETPKGWLRLPPTGDSQLLQVAKNSLTDLRSYKESDFIYNPENYKSAPLLNKAKNIICIGLNYEDHISETKLENTNFPEVFIKTSNALAQHGTNIPLIEQASHYDYEGQLVVVIGKTGKNIALEEAENYILGYTIGNDLSARDLQFRGSQWTLGKFLDVFSPIGSFLVTADSWDFDKAELVTKVNGEIRQQASLQQMIFKPAEIIVYLSQFMTLQAGDVIFTGTPSGVILGDNQNKYPWLTKGDTIKISITGLGILENQLT